MINCLYDEGNMKPIIQAMKSNVIMFHLLVLEKK